MQQKHEVFVSQVRTHLVSVKPSRRPSLEECAVESPGWCWNHRSPLGQDKGPTDSHCVRWKWEESVRRTLENAGIKALVLYKSETHRARTRCVWKALCTSPTKKPKGERLLRVLLVLLGISTFPPTLSSGGLLLNLPRCLLYLPP